MNFSTLDEVPEMSRQVAEILYKEWKDDFKRFDNIDTIEQLEEHIKQSKVFLACFKEEVIGVATISKEDWGVRPDLTPWLANVCIKPKYRHMGVGKSLVRFVLSHVKKPNPIYLWTCTEKLVKYYEMLGFKLLQYLDTHIYVMYYIPK